MLISTQFINIWFTELLCRQLQHLDFITQRHAHHKKCTSNLYARKNCLLLTYLITKASKQKCVTQTHSCPRNILPSTRLLWSRETLQTTAASEAAGEIFLKVVPFAGTYLRPSY